MQTTLIICTYMRPIPLQTLLDSIYKGTVIPSEILIVDGSRDDQTKEMLASSVNYDEKITYFKVSETDRGLTKQRNYGIRHVAVESTITCFLDDDTVVAPNYFKALIETYTTYPNALGVGGYITNEVSWNPLANGEEPTKKQFTYDGWVRSEGSRFVLRKKLGLDADVPPGFLPEFSHGRSISFLPPTGKTYPVDLFMGGVASYKTEILKQHQFSEYFVGYGLYEDADFTLRLSNIGELYVNTAAQIEHYHDAAGRPNKFEYGKMVVQNGWYVWRVKYPKPSLKARVKWHAITILLTKIRMINVITTSQKQEAFTEALGRMVAWFGLIFRKPKHDT